MALKPKKDTTNEKTRKLMNRAYDLRNIEKVGATSADKAKRNRQSLDASKTAARAVGIANRQDKKKAAAKKASYSPKPMTAAAKKKAAAAGKTTEAKTKPKSLASKVAGRAKTVAREVRDVKTAVGTSLRDQEQNVRRAAMGVKPTGKNVGGNLKKQIKEVGSAINSGKKGTASDMYNKPGAYKSGTKRK